MQVMKRLCAAGYVESVRGVHGGYALARDPKDIILGPLLDEVEGHVPDAACRRGRDGLAPHPHGPACPDYETCPHGDPIHRVHRKLRDFLQNVTLADIMGNRSEVMLPAGLETGESDS